MGHLLRLVAAIGALGFAATAVARDASPVLVFYDPGFPAADSAPPTREQLQRILPDATLVQADGLAVAVDHADTRLLVLPYGSAFPEQAWPAVRRYLQKGGNLLAIGGKPFTRAAYRDGTEWRLRPDSVRFIRPLMIDQYQATPGSQGLGFTLNRDHAVDFPAFDWDRSHSLVIRLSAKNLYNRGGSAGSLDARLDTLAWGTKDGIAVAAPVVQIDHLRNGFDGGRWIFVNANVDARFWSATGEVVARLAKQAAEGAEAFTVRPALPLYEPDERVAIEVDFTHPTRDRIRRQVRVALFPEATPSQRTVIADSAALTAPLSLKAPKAPGLYILEAELLVNGVRKRTYRSGFWMRDPAFLRSGPRLSVNRDFFELDGKPLAVVGTTHMSSDVQRLFFARPNVAVWNQDLGHIRAAGMNMIRTGWWTGWDRICDHRGAPNKHALRALEAYLMTARKHGLPVQFNFFAFVPEILGGKNPYLDPAAVERQGRLVSTVAGRFADVPFVAWDLINEPSFSTRLWTMRPNGDAIEKAAWNAWLDARYPDKADLAERWNAPESSVHGASTPPSDGEFWNRGVYGGQNPLRVYDYFLFAQERFARWTLALRGAIRAAGSKQLVTIGQDEGGGQDRVSPAFWSTATDFTTNHSWWQNDALLWDSLVAKQLGQPMLIQETGLQRELYPDEKARRSLENEATLLERKLALSFVRGAGAIQWLWHSNSYMTDSNETPIGAVRPDGSEKPEAAVLRRFATFAASLSPYLQEPEAAEVAVITSQAAQFSVQAELQIEAQRKAVRALAYHARIIPMVLAENRVSELTPKTLAILPSPQALSESAWQTLLKHVERGGNLLVTGPVERDEHWRIRPRAASASITASIRPLTYHQTHLGLPGASAIPVSFDQSKQAALDTLRFPDGAAMKEIHHGQGRIYWTADPIELAEGTEPAAALYRHVLSKVGISPRFESRGPISPGVLVCPVPLGKHVLYVFASEDARDQAIAVTDKKTGVRMAFTLRSEHAALALVDGSQTKVTASYGY